MMKMVEPVDLKNLVKHIANDRLGELCFLCLVSLENCSFENIFTLICKEETEYCIADALKAVCQVELDRSDNYNVCVDCFRSASRAYQFHLQAKRSMELLTFYSQELLNNVNNIEITNDDAEKSLFIPLPEYTPTTGIFDFNLDGIGLTADRNESDSVSITNNCSEQGSIRVSKDLKHDPDSDSIYMQNGGTLTEQTDDVKLNIRDDNHLYDANDITDHNSSIPDIQNEYESEIDEKNTEDNIIIVVEKEETPSLDDNDDNSRSIHLSDEDMVMIINEKKVRKKRDPLVYMICSQCPVKYRFVSKLKAHMKTVHNIDLFYCKICKLITEQKEEYEKHLKMHTDKHQCTVCNMVYKRASTLMAHMKVHKNATDSEQVQQSENANVCELCGAILPHEAALDRHMRERHVKRYTCFYCGRMYRWEGSFEKHVRKHEDYWNKKEGSKSEESSSKQADKLDKSKRSVCPTCGKDFVDERALLWHQRLHNNDRPYTCEVCGRGFVSVNRRNQHAVCAHTPPRRRCPLCPALFHLRSMVNTHLKKVHLKTHKRRNRTSKHQNVFWRTRAVPIQELSIDLQDHVMELQAAQHDKLPESEKESATFY